MFNDLANEKPLNLYDTVILYTSVSKYHVYHT